MISPLSSTRSQVLTSYDDSVTRSQRNLLSEAHASISTSSEMGMLDPLAQDHRPLGDFPCFKTCTRLVPVFKLHEVHAKGGKR